MKRFDKLFWITEAFFGTGIFAVFTSPEPMNFALSGFCLGFGFALIMYSEGWLPKHLPVESESAINGENKTRQK